MMPVCQPTVYHVLFYLPEENVKGRFGRRNIQIHVFVLAIACILPLSKFKRLP